MALDPTFELALYNICRDFTELSDEIYKFNVDKGWYTDPKTGEPLDRNVMEMLMLIVSEVSEAAEGWRKDLMDGHLPQHNSVIVELADTLIRIFDLAGYLRSGKFEFYKNSDLGMAFFDKFQYNDQRADHKLSNRAADNGKKC